jgi:hypothetical protein
MKLDKELNRQAYELHRQYNEAELRESIRNAGRLSPEKTWLQYVALWEFCMKLSPQPSKRQEQVRHADLERYYARIQKLEEWRQRVGKAA